MILNEVFPLVYCINLAERKERRRQAKSELDKLNIEFEFFDAIKDENPVIGCWKSHINILEDAIIKQCNVFIFEDDVEFIEGEETIDGALRNLCYLTYQKKDWWMFYLGGNILRPFYQVADYLGRLSHCQSTHACGLRWQHIETILPVIKKYRGMPLDVIYADIIVPNVEAYISIPMAAIQRADYSDIEKTEMNYDIPLARYKKFLVQDGRK